MASIQERLQMKRVPMDTWSIKEKLCLATSVVRSGDQNWMSVSRALKSFGDGNRPLDWFSQKSCAAQYDSLLGPVEKPKRKSRTPEGAVETPPENILKKLTNERLEELLKRMTDMRVEYRQIQSEIDELQSDSVSDERILSIWSEVEAAQRQEERERVRHTQWLREREDRRQRVERPWHLPAPSSQPGASPLLTSLLKSPTPQPQVSPIHLLHVPHPSTISDTISPSAGAPTLSMLLEKPAGLVTHAAQLPLPPPTIPDSNENAIIELIKSDLQQYEKKLKGNQSLPILIAPIPSPADVSLPSIEGRAKTPEKIDIDDIEIKDEDVYVFSDIDLEIAPVSSIHKSIVRGIDSSIFKKDTPLPVLEDLPEPHDFVTEPIIEEPALRTETPAQILDESLIGTVDNVNVIQDGDKENNSEGENAILEDTNVPETSIPEISELEPSIVTTEPNVDYMISPESVGSIENTTKDLSLPTHVEENQSTIENLTYEPDVQPKNKDGPDENVTSSVECDETSADIKPLNEANTQAEWTIHNETDTNETDVNSTQMPILQEVKAELETIEEPSLEQQEPLTTEIEENLNNDIDTKTETDTKGNNAENDEDTPMEIIREEDKLGRTKRDYSRKKPDRESSDVSIGGDVPIKTEPLDDLTEQTDKTFVAKSKMKENLVHKSGSESPSTPIDSLPASPGTPVTPLPLQSIRPTVKTPSTSSTSSSIDDDKDHKLWKKSVMLVYSRLCGHKNASIFSRPITDEQAPSYSVAVKRPMDLQTIKRNIDSGVLRTTTEFHRDVLLMLSNALMYNSSSHHVYSMAQEMHQEVIAQMGMLLQAQAHAALSVTSTPTRRPHTTSGSSSQLQIGKKKRRGDSTSSSTSNSSKKRKEEPIE